MTFELDLNVGAYRHLDDTTVAAWRHFMFFFFHVTFEEVFTSYLNCIRFGCNTSYH